MPTTEETLTLSQVRTIRVQGSAEIITRIIFREPASSSFSSQDDPKSYLVEALGAKARFGGIGGAVSWKGRYVQHPPMVLSDHLRWSLARYHLLG